MTDPCVWTADVSAYLLGALPDDEHASFAAHLATCGACQQEAAELEHAAAVMPLAVEHRQPPPALKANLMATVRAEAELLRAAGAEADQLTRAPRRSWFPKLVAPVAVGLAVAVLGFAGFEALQGGSPTVEQTIQANVRLPEGTAHVQKLDASRGRLVLDGVPAPPTGHVYELWLVRPGEAPVAAGTIAEVKENGTTVADVDGDLRGVPSLLVTVEPAPGSAAPTAKPVMEAKLS